jgi:broad specificity phosphatase PhoE
MTTNNLEIWLVRHGETEWSISGQHSGRHDLPLTPRGEEEALGSGRLLNGRSFDLVLCSPLQRARRTCELAGYLHLAEIEPDIAEWDYGKVTGRTAEDMQREFPDWSVWSGPLPGGETIEDISKRARRVLSKLAGRHGRVAFFSHGHFLRVFATQYLGIAAENGRHFALSTASLCILGYDQGFPAIRCWNAPESI